MRRFFLIAIFLFISFLCAAQQFIPGKVIGRIPEWDSSKLYQIQVGAFRTSQKADEAHYKLIMGGMIPSRESYLDLTRVMLRGIPANEVTHYLIKMKMSGFSEVIIREDPGIITISEKWEVNSPDREYSSFEFNHDKNYIVVENTHERRARFGAYNIPHRDIINLDALGTIKIKSYNETEISFSFTPINEPDREVDYSAVKAGAIPVSPELDLLSRTWRVVDCTEKEYIDDLIFISSSGTYFFTYPDGSTSRLSQWRWYDEKKEGFEYSHDNWEHYGRVKINELKSESFIFIDPGYSALIPGYSDIDLNLLYELVPANN